MSRNKLFRGFFVKVLIGVILAAGVIHGMFISGGPLLIIYAVKKIKDKESFRATLSPVWSVLNTYILIKQILFGVITSNVMGTVLVGMPALMVGVIIGGKLATKMSQKTFLGLSYGLLLISCLSLIL